MARLTKQQAILYRKVIENAVKSLSDEEALTSPLLFPRWKTGIAYVSGDRVSYEADGVVTLYKCREGMSHTSQDDWTPNIAVSLWKRVDDPTEEWPEWVRPTGAHDAYDLGAKVSHNDKHWISIYDGANIWEPGVYGWEEA